MAASTMSDAVSYWRGDVEHRRDIDTRGVRFSHTDYDVGETLAGSTRFSVVR